MGISLLQHNYDGKKVPIPFANISSVDVNSINNVLDMTEKANICLMDVRTHDGDTLLHVIVRYGLCHSHFNTVGIDIHRLAPLLLSKNEQGNTPLHTAILEREFVSLYALCTAVKDNIGLCEQNKEGNTPLHLVPQMGTSEDSKRIVAAIAFYCRQCPQEGQPEFTTKNKQNKTAFEIALETIEDEEFHRNFYSLYTHGVQPLALWLELHSLKRTVFHPRLHHFIFESAVVTVEDYLDRRKIPLDQAQIDLALPIYEIEKYADDHSDKMYMSALKVQLSSEITKLFGAESQYLQQFRALCCSVQEEADKQAKTLFEKLTKTIIEGVRFDLNFTQDEFDKKFKPGWINGVVETVSTFMFNEYQKVCQWKDLSCIENGQMQNGYTVMGFMIENLLSRVRDLLTKGGKGQSWEALKKQIEINFSRIASHPIVIQTKDKSVSFHDVVSYSSQQISADILHSFPLIPMGKKLTDLRRSQLEKKKNDLESILRSKFELFKKPECKHLMEQYRLSACVLKNNSFLIGKLKENIKKELSSSFKSGPNIQLMRRKKETVGEAIEKGCITFLQWLREEMGVSKIQEMLTKKCISSEELSQAKAKDHDQALTEVIEFIQEIQSCVLNGIWQVDGIRGLIASKKPTGNCIRSTIEEMEVIETYYGKITAFLNSPQSKYPSPRKSTSASSTHQVLKGLQPKSKLSTKSELSPDIYRHHDEVFSRHRVQGNGDCGYTAFGFMRNQACEFLMEHHETARHVKSLIMDIKEKLLDEEFIEYITTFINMKNKETFLDDFNSHKRNPSDDRVKDKLQGYASDPIIIQAYFSFDIMYKQNWCSVGTLSALAHIKEVNLFIWKISNENEEQLELLDYYYPFSREAERVDLLFVNHNHFDRLMLEEPTVISSPSLVSPMLLPPGTPPPLPPRNPLPRAAENPPISPSANAVSSTFSANPPPPPLRNPLPRAAESPLTSPPASASLLTHKNPPPFISQIQQASQEMRHKRETVDRIDKQLEMRKEERRKASLTLFPGLNESLQRRRTAMSDSEDESDKSEDEWQEDVNDVNRHSR
jgi:hypothetical protein